MEALSQLPMFYYFAMFVAGLWSFIYLRKTRRLPPGPLGLPLLGSLPMLGDLPHRGLHKLSQKYGPIMHLRLGLVPTVVVSSPEMAELFLKKHDLTFASRPHLQASDYLSYGRRGMGFAEYGPYWRNARKLCSVHLLTMAKVDSFSPLRVQEVGDLVTYLKAAAAEGREIVNISAQVGSVLEKITYGMIFGIGYRERFHFKPCIDEALRLFGVFNAADFIPFLRYFDLQGLKRRMQAANDTMDVFLEKIIEEHERESLGQQEHHPTDFIGVMLALTKSTDGQEEKLQRISMKAFTMDLVGGSMDTSATTIEWALTELVRHPQVMKKLQEELVNVVGLDRLVEESDLPKLAYLHMVVKEILRLHPVSPLLLPRESREDITIEGFYIPKNSRIIINSWAIARDPNTWSSNAEEFYPERFNNTDIDIRGNNMQLLPFGSGRRICPGMELGLRTVQYVLAQLVHCIDFELPEGVSTSDVDMNEKFGLTLPRASPLLVVPKYRLCVK